MGSAMRDVQGHRLLAEVRASVDVDGLPFEKTGQPASGVQAQLRWPTCDEQRFRLDKVRYQTSDVDGIPR